MLSQCEFTDEGTQKELNRNTIVTTGVVTFPETLNLELCKIEGQSSPNGDLNKVAMSTLPSNTLKFPWQSPVTKGFAVPLI